MRLPRPPPEAGGGDVPDGGVAVGGGGRGREGRVGGQGEVEAGEGDEVGLELVQVHV